MTIRVPIIQNAGQYEVLQSGDLIDSSIIFAPGSDTEVIYNSSDVLTGAPNIRIDNTNKRVLLGADNYVDITRYDDGSDTVRAVIKSDGSFGSFASLTLHSHNEGGFGNQDGRFILDADGSQLIGYSTGDLFWDGSVVWHAGNDGSGSTLDADLLDGQHGDHYLDSIMFDCLMMGGM